MSTETINAAIDNLVTIQSQLIQLASSLSDQNKMQDAAKVTTRSDALTKVISQLQSAALNQWSQDADTLAAQIVSMGNGLQSCIDEISNTISIAQNVVKALSIADQALTKAKGLLTA